MLSFDAFLREQSCSETTVRHYRNDMEKFSLWYEGINGGAFAPGLLTPSDARQYKQHLQHGNAAPATINRRLSALRAYAEWAQSAGLLSANPLRGVKGVEEQKHAPRWLTKKQQFSLLQEVEKDINAAKTEPARAQALRNQTLVALLLHTGLRVSELCSLRLDDLTLSTRKGELRVRTGKREKYRAVPLNKTARAVLVVWVKERAKGNPSVLFAGQNGQPLTVRSVERIIAELGRRAKIEGLTPHVLRHTFAKNLVDMSISLEKVATLLGHESLETTMIYVTPGKADLEQAVEALE